MCAVSNLAVFCSSLIFCFPSMWLRYFLNDFEIVQVAVFIVGITSGVYIPLSLFLLQGILFIPSLSLWHSVCDRILHAGYIVV